LEESLSIVEKVQFSPDVTDPPNLGGSRFTATDRFATRNQFYGAQAGVEGRWAYGRLSVGALGKLALGVTQQDLVIDGSSTISPPVPNNRPGNLLALASNIGTFHRSSFSAVPELGVNLGYNFTDHLRGSVGYNVLWWSGVLRPGDQIDRNLNAGLIPLFPDVNTSGQNRPAVPFKESVFWAHGLTVGLELAF